MAILGDDATGNSNTLDLEYGPALIPNVNTREIYFYRPDSNNPDKVIKNRYRLRTNSLGFRGGEVLPEDTGKLRVMCVGDSSTFGFGEEEENIYPTVLEKKLSAAGPARVYNFGVPGHTSAQGILVFRRFASKADARVVVISYGGNDWTDVNIKPPFSAMPNVPDAQYYYTGAPRDARTKAYTAALRFVTSHLTHSYTLSYFQQWLGKHYRLPPLAGRPRVTIEEFKHNLGILIDESRNRGAIPVIIAGLCAPLDYERAAVEAAQSNSVTFLATSQILDTPTQTISSNPSYLEVYKEMQIRFGMEFLKEYPNLATRNDVCHPNKLGHLMIGEALADIVGKTLISGR